MAQAPYTILSVAVFTARKLLDFENHEKTIARIRRQLQSMLFDLSQEVLRSVVISKSYTELRGQISKAAKTVKLQFQNSLSFL